MQRLIISNMCEKWMIVGIFKFIHKSDYRNFFIHNYYLSKVLFVPYNGTISCYCFRLFSLLVPFLLLFIPFLLVIHSVFGHTMLRTD